MGGGGGGGIEKRAGSCLIDRMNKLLLLTLLALGHQTASAQLVTESFGRGGDAFSMDFVTIGNPNNAVHTTGSPNPAGEGLRQGAL